MTEMTSRAVQLICKETGGYNTKHLNEKLYLHFKGWNRIENLDDFTGARVVWLEGNGLQKIENLQPCSHLRQIYLQQNCIKTIENLDGFDELRALNLSENFIQKIEGLSKLPCLETLQLNNNHITTLEDVELLRECPSVHVLELSKCKIEDPAVIDVFESMPNLKLLKLDGNPVVRKIPGYRKTLICRLKKLTYLDDRPVFEEERQTAEAWGRGGVEAEKTERARQRQLKKMKEDQRHKSFLKMIDDAKRERRAQKKAEAEAADDKKVIASTSEDQGTITNEREKAQEELVAKLDKEVPKSSSRKRQGGKRTKCVITETEDGAAIQDMRTKCVINEVSVTEQPQKAAWEGSEGAFVSAVSQSSKSRKSNHRKDREARLRRAMAAVDAGRSESDTCVTSAAADAGEVDKAAAQPEVRFGHLSSEEIEKQLCDDKMISGEAANTGLEEQCDQAPTLWGTKKYDELWEKASEMHSEICDDASVEAVVENDSTVVCDLEDLD